VTRRGSWGVFVFEDRRVRNQVMVVQGPFRETMGRKKQEVATELGRRLRVTPVCLFIRGDWMGGEHGLLFFTAR
jgi:hypothetical protein